MKKLLFILFLFIGSFSYGQTIFTQTYIDRCTGDVKVVVANFTNGSATVAFYDKVRTFTYEEFLAGELQSWLTETYLWWQALSPCSTATAETQAAQQTAQNAAAAASTASTAATNATAAVPPPASTPPPSTGGTTNATNTSTNQTSNTDSQNTSSSSSSQSSQSESSNTGNGGETTESGGGGETTESQGGGTEESKSEGGGTEESKSEEKTEEVKEETKEESKEESSEEKKEEESKEESEEESSEEESDEESEESEEKEEEKKEKKEKKQSKMMPIQLRSDMMANQALLGNYDIVTSIGATQSSIYGDESYGATMMIWSNLRQFSLNTSYTKVHMQKFDVSTLVHNGTTYYAKGKSATIKDSKEPIIPGVSSITSASLGYMNNFGNGTIVGNYMKIKPSKYGTFGAGLNMANNFGEGKYQNTMLGYNVLYTNQVMLNPRINYAPAFIWTQSPYVGTLNGQNQMRGQRIHGMMILANSFTIQLTRRFSFNAGATFIKSTDPNIPLIKSFMIGAKLPF